MTTQREAVSVECPLLPPLLPIVQTYIGDPCLSPPMAGDGRRESQKSMLLRLSYVPCLVC